MERACFMSTTFTPLCASNLFTFLVRPSIIKDENPATLIISFFLPIPKVFERLAVLAVVEKISEQLF